MRFFGALFLNDFWSVFFLVFFVIFGRPEAPFWEAFWLFFKTLGPQEKQLKVCNRSKFRGLALPDGVFLEVVIVGAFWRWVFRFLWFRGVLRLPFWDLLVLKTIKKGAREITCKKCEKRVVHLLSHTRSARSVCGSSRSGAGLRRSRSYRGRRRRCRW